MVTHGRVELLAHPLSQKYLQMKWNAYGKYFHVTNLLIYTVFLAFVTIYASQLMQNVDQNSTIIESTVSILSNSTAMPLRSSYQYNENVKSNEPPAVQGFQLKNPISISTLMAVSAYTITIYVVGQTFREFFQIYNLKWQYLFEPNNLISWMLYISSTIMVSSVFNGGWVNDVHFSATSITVFLSWFNLLLFLQRFDQVGIYVVMFLEILQTLIRVLLVFSILIIAFGLAFYIVLSKSKVITAHSSTSQLAFSTIPMSLVRAFSMMLGEMDFIGTYVQPYWHSELPLPVTSFVLLCLFMILMPILLMNLLIGLAVGDIESVRRNAQLKRLAMQVVLHTELEQKLPQIWIQKADRTELIEYPNSQKCKLGIFDIVLRKWFCNPFNDENNIDIGFDTTEEILADEMEKQRRKLRDITTTLEQQHHMLRLIVQKMEIKTEADDVDEGVSPTDFRATSAIISNSNASRWSSPRIRKKLKHAKSFNKSA